MLKIYHLSKGLNTMIELQKLCILKYSIINFVLINFSDLNSTVRSKHVKSATDLCQKIPMLDGFSESLKSTFF